MRRAKIIATLGPASNSEQVIRELIEAGANAFRLNFSHGTHDDHRRRVERVRRLCAELDLPVAIIQDLSGPKIRTGYFEGGGSVELGAGDLVTLTGPSATGTAERIPISYPRLTEDIPIGGRVLLDDGRLELQVVERVEDGLRCEVVNGGKLGTKKGVNFPGVPLPLPALTDKDREDLAFGLTLDIDYVALSFVRRADDVRELRRLIADHDKAVPVIAKIERPEALDDMAAILDASDGVMVARGDLGVELPPERVPVLQKQIVEQANRGDCLVIIATQMLESMMHDLRPTRAEASDVANAVIDGADAVMLSGETAVGEYPVETVRMMARIVEEAERSGRRRDLSLEPGGRDRSPTYAHAIAHAAWDIAGELDLDAIIAFTQSGFTARLIAKDRPRVPILAATPHLKVWRRLALMWGVTPIQCSFVEHTDGMIHVVERELVERNCLEPEDLVVVMGGMPVTTRGPTNFLKIHLIRAPETS